MKMTTTYAAFVGLDWADRYHQVCLRAADSARDEQSVLPHEPWALHTWAQGLRRRFPQGKIALALEQTRGPLISALSPYEHLELYALNPAMLAKYREAATAASGTKNDPLDAGLACELVRIHRDWLRPLPAVPAALRELQLLLEARRGLVEQRTGLGNQLTAALKGYYPQALLLVGGDVGSPLAAAFLRRWPTLAAVQRARPQTLRRFYYAHHVRSAERIAERLAVVRAAVALTLDAAVLATLPVAVAVGLDLLAVLAPAIADYDRRIAANFAGQADARLFAGLPGAVLRGDARQARDGLLVGGRRADVWQQGLRHDRASDATSGSLLGSSMPSRTRRSPDTTGSSASTCPTSLWTELHKSPCGGRGTGKNPTDRAKLGWKWSVLTDKVGIPFGWTADGANRNDSVLLVPTLEDAERRGLTEEMETVWLDRGYDSEATRVRLPRRGSMTL